MSHAIALPSRRPTRTGGFDLSPALRIVIGAAAGTMTLAIGIALARAALGLAPAHPSVREFAVVVHVLTVLPAVPLGAYLMLSRKGDRRHRMLGRVWIMLMVATALSALFIRHINGGGFSFIHLFVPLTLIGAVQVVRTARAGQIAKHRRHLIGLYLGSLMIPGIFAFAGDRLMAVWLFG